MVSLRFFCAMDIMYYAAINLKLKLMFNCPVKCQKPENMIQIVVSVLICPITITIHVWELLFIISSVTIIAAILLNLPLAI
jgi:hypothetical protein